MSFYKIAFCGYGSIAKRHIRNLLTILKERGDKFQMDLIRHNINLNASPDSVISKIYSYEDKVDTDYDIIFITNPTSMHYSAIIKYASHAKSLFVEKPVFNCTDLIIPDELLKDKILYVACPLRYSGVLQYIKNNVPYKSAFSVRATSSSYLPDWRPNTDYRLTYSADKKLGGGVSIDLIHEWDYLTYLFGFPLKVNSIISQKSQLEIDSDDIAIYISEYNERVIEVHLDYFGRKTIRTLELYLPDETIIADLANFQIRYMNDERTISINENRDAFQKRELQHFLDIIEGKADNDSTWQDAVKVLKIAKGEY